MNNRSIAQNKKRSVFLAELLQFIFFLFFPPGEKRKKDELMQKFSKKKSRPKGSHSFYVAVYAR